MNMFTPLYLAFVAIFVTILPTAYQRAVEDCFNARLIAQASLGSCPVLLPGDVCTWQVWAKDHGTWAPCDKDRAPSGANLPSHRWFLLIPTCRMEGVPLWVPKQLIYR